MISSILHSLHYNLDFYFCVSCYGFSIESLSQVLKYYTPLVIGYGGNDGSLMNFLENQNELHNGIVWFYLESGGEPNDKIKNIVSKMDGYFVEIDGFDELMLHFGELFNIKPLSNELIEIAEERTKTHYEQFTKLSKSNLENKLFQEAIERIKKKQKSTWMTVYEEIKKENDLGVKDSLFKSGLDMFNESSELMNNYAIFLVDQFKNFELAEKYYKNAIQLRSNNPIYKTNYALLLYRYLNRNDEAEELINKAILDDPTNTDSYLSLAIFYERTKNSFSIIEEYYLSLISKFPSEDSFKLHYALFLDDIKKDYNSAKSVYEDALNQFPKHQNFIVNYIKLLIQMDDLEKAKELIDLVSTYDIENDDTLIELNFYKYAVFQDIYKDAEKILEEMVNKGVKSEDWNFDRIIEMAKLKGHKNISKLNNLSDRISK